MRPGPYCPLCGMETCSWNNGKRCEGRLHRDRVKRRDAERCAAERRLREYVTNVVVILAITFLFGVVVYGAVAGTPVPY